MKFIDPTGMYAAGFSSSNYVLSGQFMDEITVVASLGMATFSGSITVNAGMSNPHADFKNFLYGNHAGGRNFGASRGGSRDWGLLDVANARAFYERRSDASTSVAGIFFNEVLLDVLPATQGELGVELAMAALPPAKFAKLAELAKKAGSDQGRKGMVQLVSLAKKAGLKVTKGGNHLNVIDPTTGNKVTQIPHSLKGKQTAVRIAKAIMDVAKGE